MAHHWQDGFADRSDPQAPIDSPLGSGIMVQPPTRLLPEEYQIASKSSLAQAQALDPGAAPDSWTHCPQPDNCQPQAPASSSQPQAPEFANVVWPEDPGVAVQFAIQAPKSPFDRASGGAQALAAFYEVTDRAGFPRNAAQLKWGDRDKRPAHMNENANVMQGLYDGVDWTFINSFPLERSWNLQTGAVCCYIEERFNEEN